MKTIPILPKADLFPLMVVAMKESGKDNVTDEQVAIIKLSIEKYGTPDEVKYGYSYYLY